MEVEHEFAFRTLQRGLHVGKVVLRITCGGRAGANGVHVVTGGTGGLGMLTARWLAQRGAQRLVLASRDGVRVRAVTVEWEALRSSETVT